ncbi:hypothetical protein V9T40_006617 [Parthenolecanium corni]|uniref:Neutral ceramidase n=1 Tax=Parthenolecanium corni TaxID=536013 RepID=A0AAN9Y7A2_9HEMI
MDDLRVHYVFLIFLGYSVLATSEAYRIGIGIADVTGPSVGIPFMGYANIEQKGQGIHLRQFSRAFIINDGIKTFVFVSVDCGMIGDGIRQSVLKRLQRKHQDLYTHKNVMISGTHTHSAPGGYLMDFLFDASTLGFVPETFNALVKGITLSIERAHKHQKEGRIFKTVGTLLNTNINRSPTAYALNPEAERQRYDCNVDRKMVQLKFFDTKNKGIGMISWFAVHPTSMNYTNKLVSSDNVGYASILFEQKMNPRRNLIGKGPFVAAFASTNLGDVSPNIKGPRCQKSGVECDMNTSKCPSNTEFCVASGPGNDIFESTKIIAENLYSKAGELWNSPGVEITGNIHSVHQYVHMPSQTAEYENPSTGERMIVHGCLPAMGHSFAAGTTDGPGLGDFKQGETMPSNPIWNTLTNTLATPSANQTACHGIKPILLTTGEMHFPFEWQPEIVSTQLARIGNIVIACVPGEFTTMSGRRLRNRLQEKLNLPNDDDVIIAGLCNTYSDYITTPEEYQIQRYEGASTIFGPYTLPLYLKQYEKLAEVLESEDLDFGPTPPDISSSVLSFLPPVIFDSTPWGYNFGDCIQQPPASVKIGDTVRVKFVAGHPRNNLRLENTYLTVDLYTGNWTVVATDANWETKFIWERTSTPLGTSVVEIQWHVKPTVRIGYYRIRHFGCSKSLFGSFTDYVGVTQVFKLIKS